MILDAFLTLMYQLMGSVMELLPDVGPPPSFMTSSIATIGTLEPLFPVTKFFQLISVWATMYGSLITFRAVKFVLKR